MTGTGASKMTPLHVGISYTYDFRFYSKGNASGAWAGSLKPQFAWVVRGLVPDINYKELEGFIMLGTHSEPRRGETSHTCDISVLRVNN